MPMKRDRLWGLVPWLALAGASAAGAQDTPSRTHEPPRDRSASRAKASATTPAERYRDVLKEYHKADQSFLKAYQAARTDAEREQVLKTRRPDPELYADKILKIAEDAPKDPVALEALVWIAFKTSGPRADKALRMLLTDHAQDPGIASLCAQITSINSPQAETLLRAVLARNPSRGAKGQAALALGQMLKRKAEKADSQERSEAMFKEAEALLERVGRDFPSLELLGSRSIGAEAKHELNELRHFRIGKTAPEIAGEDIDGKPMKLTDFRGKVVVLDFWGDW
jgi:hypothetical protein